MIGYIWNTYFSVDRILLYISDKNRLDFEEDFKTQDAVVRQLEIIGEATKRISMDFRRKHNEIPWSDMAGMRDILIHDYIDVDFEIVWKTASEQIPVLKELLRKV